MKNINNIKLKKQAVKFVKSGFKYKYFTKDLYEFLHIDTNKFIAHFDKLGFWNARFNKDANTTISLLEQIESGHCTYRISKYLAERMAKNAFLERKEILTCSVVKR